MSKDCRSLYQKLNSKLKIFRQKPLMGKDGVEWTCLSAAAAHIKLYYYLMDMCACRGGACKIVLLPVRIEE